MTTMTAEMKAEILRKREADEIHKRVHPIRRTKFPAPNKPMIVLPEEFTGRDLKRAKKLMKGRKK